MVEQNLLFTIVPEARECKTLFCSKTEENIHAGWIGPKVLEVQQGFCYEEVGEYAQDINGCCHKWPGGNRCIKIQTF